MAFVGSGLVIPGSGVAANRRALCSRFVPHVARVQVAVPSATRRAALKMIEEGDKAPEISLPDQDGNVVRIADFVGKSPVVVFFYPKDDSPGCTKEVCAFRDAMPDFTDLGAEVFGVSADADHAPFAAKHNLPYKLLSDTQNAARKAFGVPSLLGLLPGRVTYVINKEGTVIKVFNSIGNAAAHADEARKALQTAN
eukprot:CAMPEP_0198367526 /NCGR_PEP_ID=MMETSP1450-20131203/155233_1 /TAXON_ID=753684 ORGANISM="Madagascaria erythrocladiodes, Strain CCMP3234" /NCGR_SAMPLE_ID=MMETSP1450 /ASSEMBLY_ACC=CAM_ASM_001115 /LENGTH=195 /DNA_ID=CAMNT_0044075009 /DNA_START=41 /DNA_END=628 /DNA_ORIENTATION=+